MSAGPARSRTRALASSTQGEARLASAVAPRTPAIARATAAAPMAPRKKPVVLMGLIERMLGDAAAHGKSTVLDPCCRREATPSQVHIKGFNLLLCAPQKVPG